MCNNNNNNNDSDSDSDSDDNNDNDLAKTDNKYAIYVCVVPSKHALMVGKAGQMTFSSAETVTCYDGGKLDSCV
eukprot:2394011-Amphidinium_carterae.2